METLGERLKKQRLKQGLTQKEAANKLNINQVTYHGYEANKHKPDIDMLSKLADLLFVSTDYLIGRYQKAN